MNDGKAKVLENGQQEKAKTTTNAARRHWHECHLPKSPLPHPKHTLQRYLEFVRVLADGTNPNGVDLAKTEYFVRKFEPVAQRLQQKLVNLSGQSENWVNEFWLPEMYLRQRMPLPINFSPAYVFPRQHFRSNDEWLDYAAWLVRAMLDFKHGVDNKRTPQETVMDRFLDGNTVPLCMDQYARILNFYREPAFGEDILHDRRQRMAPKGKDGTEGTNVGEGTGKSNAFNGTDNEKGHNSGEEKLLPLNDVKQYSETTQCLADNEHIIVITEHQQFMLTTCHRHLTATAPIIAGQLAKIRTKALNRIGDTVHPVGGASTGQRERAAAFWEEMKKASVNIRSLEAIRSALFVLCLDSSADISDQSNCDHIKALEGDGLHILHGFGSHRNGLNRWFDCTIQLIVSRNGCCGLCIEHSVAEGIVIIKMAEDAMRFANKSWELKKKMELEVPKMNQTNANQPMVPAQMPPPKCLSWALNENAIFLLREQIAEFDRLAHDVQLCLLFFSHFGKSMLKEWGVSPDGFVQLAMQYAHFKLHGHLVSTYESATMRRFRYGRVDNIRAATPEALAWVKAMAERNESRDKQKRELFKRAVQKQALITRENTTGNGIDNHLCALEVLSRSEEQQQIGGSDNSSRAMFEDTAWREAMRFPLTTSQVSTSPEFVDCFLFYGPVVRDGYGCAYNIQQHKIIFAISAWKSEERTKLGKFRDCLEEALGEMRILLGSETKKTACKEK